MVFFVLLKLSHLGTTRQEIFRFFGNDFMYGLAQNPLDGPPHWHGT